MQRKVNRKSKWKRLDHDYSSSIIPLNSIVALLALSFISINPSFNFATDFISINEEVYADEPSLLTDTDTPSASLTIESPTLTANGKAGEVVYMSSNVSIKGNLINSYSLQISSGTSSGGSSNGEVILSGPTTINPIDNTTNPNGIDISSMGDNTWGYKWGDSSTGNNTNNYKGITTTPVTIANDSIDSNGTVSYTKPLTFAAKFSKDALAGHYTTTVTLSLAAAPKTLVTYTLSYNANDGNNGNSTTNLPTTQTISNYNTTHTFTIPNTTNTIPTRSGYEFAGYATSSDGDVTYQPGGNVTLQSSAPSQILYAVWEWDGTTLTPGFTNISNMQQMTSDICATANYGDYKDLKDTRDNSTYRVVKFRDNRCWMTQNLKIINKTITSTDSDTSSNFTIPASSIYGFTESNQDTRQAYTANNTGYYNWYTATAGTGTKTVTSGEVNSSICPKGWKLPSGGSNGEYQSFANAEGILDSQAGSNKIQALPYSFAYTGYIINNSHSNASAWGIWWTRTAYNNPYAYGLFIYTDKVRPGTRSDNNRYGGFAVRCVAE